MKRVASCRKPPVAFWRRVCPHNPAEGRYKFLVNLELVTLPSFGLPLLLFRKVKTCGWNNDCSGGGNNRHSYRRVRRSLHQLQPFQLYAVAADLGEVVLGLLHKPAFLGAAENLGQPHGHFGRYATLPVYKFGKRVARHPKGDGGVCDGLTDRLNALLQHDKARVGRVFHGHQMVPFSGNRHNQRPPRRPLSGKSPASWRAL